MSDLSKLEQAKWSTSITDITFEKLKKKIEDIKRKYKDYRVDAALSEIESAITLAILFKSEDI